jgi:putative heme-binding domain-containing protein
MRLALLLSLSGCAAIAQQVPIANPHTTPADRAAGAKIFRSHCAPCHGSNAQGGVGPSLATGIFFHGSTDGDIYRNVTEGIVGTAMPGTFFEGTQVWQVIAYIRSLGATAGAAPPGDSKRGETLFREKGCSGCHLARGEGGVRGPDLSFAGSQRSADYLRESILDPNANVQPEYWVAKITLNNGKSYSGFVMNEDTHFVQMLDFSKGLQSLRRSDFKSFDMDKNSSMPSYKGTLTGQEVDDLVSYLWSLKRQGRSE